MALIHCDFFARTLGMASSMTVILPQAGVDSGDAKPPYATLFLLHGLSDDHTAWTRRTSIERYVAGTGLAVVMPAVGRSFYTDMRFGQSYWTFISEELPDIARSLFPLASEREKTFVAGLSMGGYGAFKLALARPENFAAAASLSGCVDVAAVMHNREQHGRETETMAIFGGADAVAGSDADLFHLADMLAASDRPRPVLYQMCGMEDGLYQGNIAFRDHAKKIGLALKYEEDAGYAHTWDYWDTTIRRVLDWLPL